MQRASGLLFRAYEAYGYRVQVLKPSAHLSERSDARFASRELKILIYIEKLLIFPARLLLKRWTKNSQVHIADHSDAIWLNFIPEKVDSTVTVHDVLAIRAARGDVLEHQTELPGRIYQWAILRGLQRAKLLVAVSDVTAHDLHELGVPGRIVVVKNPLSDSFTRFRKSTVESTAPPQGEYALIVSTLGWRKRRERAIRFWSLYEDQLGLKELHVVGPSLTDLELSLVDPDKRDRISSYHGITEGELLGQYAQAKTLLQFSKYEGFCWPIVEANASGCPAVCADEPILRETGDGNYFIDLDQLEELTPGTIEDIQDFFNDGERIEILRDRAMEFTERRYALDLMSKLDHADAAECPPRS